MTERRLTREEARKRIHDEHTEIRAQLARVEELTDRVHQGDREAVLALREQLSALGELLLAHLYFEEYELSSLMTEGSPEQARAAAIMHQEHESQKELLNRAIRELDETAVGLSLVVGVRELVRAIREDMEHEEAELLNRP